MRGAIWRRGEVADLTGLPINQVAGRCARGALRSQRIRNEYLISVWESPGAFPTR